jgi:hypothetical protein
VALTSNLEEREIRHYTCDCCRAPIERVWNYVYRDDVPRAVYFANCYHHTDQPHDVWMDIIIGTWGQNGAPDHVTFGCRVGPVVDSPQPGATLVDPLYGQSGAPIHGRVLSREAALGHPQLAEFWEVVDFVLMNDPTVHPHLYAS